MLISLCDAFEKADRRQVAATRRQDDVIDKLNTAIKAYITSLDPGALGDADHQRVRGILAFATNMEQAAGIVTKDLLGIVAKKIKRDLAFSESGQIDLLAMLDRLLANVRTAASLAMTGDERAARLLASEKKTFRGLEAAATEAHFERLRSGRIDTAETSALHLDALRYLKSVNAHLVAGAAYPLLESKGDLLPSRLRQDA